MAREKHDIESATEALYNKGLSRILTVIKIEGEFIVVKDNKFGEYRTQVKNLSPCMDFPLHKFRKHYEKLSYLKNKFIGKKLNSFTIIDVFYGPDHGYKNRSFYFSYLGECGHPGLATNAFLMKHKKTLFCLKCSGISHGERKKICGIRAKRTTTYTSWVSFKKILPEKYRDFSVFKDEIGEKPYKKAEITIIDGKPFWKNISLTEDQELNLIATAVRQAFRHSKKYKECIDLARIETNEGGVMYKCAQCGELFKRKDIQVDHISPISSVDGSPLIRDEIIKKIWDSPIQILDKKCHTKKSTLENKLRRSAKRTIC